MMTSVLQEVEGLTKKLYSIILPVERPVSKQNFRLNVHTVFLFWHRYSLHYNVLSGPIIIIFSRSKGVKKIICLCTSSDEILFTCKISGPKLPRLLSYASSWRSRRRRWITFTCISYLMWHFHPIFCMQLLFLHVLHLDVIRSHIELKLKVKTANILMYGYNAGPPMAIPVLPYCVILPLSSHNYIKLWWSLLW